MFSCFVFACMKSMKVHGHNLYCYFVLKHLIRSYWIMGLDSFPGSLKMLNNIFMSKKSHWEFDVCYIITKLSLFFVVVSEWRVVHTNLWGTGGSVDEGL